MNRLVIATVLISVLLALPTVFAEDGKLPARDVEAEKLMYERSWDQGVVVVVYEWVQYGTGWWIYVDREQNYGYIVTAAHVVAYDSQADESKITIIKGSFEARGRVVYLDRFSDVCIIKVSPVPPAFYVFDISLNMNKGDKIIVIGYPYELLTIYSNDLRRMSANPRASFGEITWLDTNYRLAEIGTYTDAGNSGGPVINEKGHVVGIVTFALSGRAATLYFMTTSHSIVEALERAGVPYQLAPDSPRLSEVIDSPWVGLAVLKSALPWIGAGAFLTLLVVLPLVSRKR